MKQYDECPNCAEDGDRWVYLCEDCGFEGCYDEVNEDGCFVGDYVTENCPKCESANRTRIGAVGAGTSEE